MDDSHFPQHIAIIMDGNGRWAAQRGLPRLLGHRAGADAVTRVTEAACELGISALTLYAFSWENWDRPAQEIRDLMRLLDEFLLSQAPTLRRQRIRLRAIGRLEALPDGVRRHLQAMVDETAGFDRMTLALALSYGGRQEIVDAARRLAQAAREGRLDPSQIDEEQFRRQLYCPELPDPDLLIRTSGEQRISNFLLWQISYCELYVTPTCWPDFTKAELQEAIAAYQKRDRRFGRTASHGAARSNGQAPPRSCAPAAGA